ncbi:hypothetical protein HMPREF0262_00623 [Clostridium sp. ATCC 29733]|nr:hypothetical protein HMPREF0262_00623 [Clostridium sp. ATCC 29733]
MTGPILARAVGRCFEGRWRKSGELMEAFSRLGGRGYQNGPEIGGRSGRGRWSGQEGRAFQRRETGKKGADVHGTEKLAKGKPVAMVQGNWQGSSRERWCGKPCKMWRKRQYRKSDRELPNAIAQGNWRGHTQRRSAGKAMGGCPGNGRTQGSRREGDWALPRRKFSKKKGWEWGLGKPMGGCSRAAAPEN